MSALAAVKSAPTLAQLAYEWRAIKDAEKAAQEKRLAIEAAMLGMVQHLPEGTVTTEAGDIKVKVTYKVTRSVDVNGVQDDWNVMPSIVQEAFRWKPDLDLKRYRAIETANPEAFKLLAKYVTSKEAKPSISVESE